MTEQSPVLAVLNDEADRAIAMQLAAILGYPFAHVVMGDGHDAARYITQMGIEPRYILFVIGDRRETADEELNALAAQCVAGTKVVVAGVINDIQFYRSIIDKGVQDYFTLPLDVRNIAHCFGRRGDTGDASSNARVYAFCSAASGDGASTIAVNAAYALSKQQQARTVIVDMDYQFGMVAKNLDLSTPYGLKELLEHPDRGIDATLIERMVVSYNQQLHVVGAPNGLHYYPLFKPELIREMIDALKQRYDYVILDFPRFWAPWVSVAFTQADHIYLVAQLWLKSVAHASRQLNAWKQSGLDINKVHVCVNRRGAKFKEGVTPKDFERVCGRVVEYYFPNDIRTVVDAEQKGCTILDLKKSALGEEIKGLAEKLYHKN